MKNKAYKIFDFTFLFWNPSLSRNDGFSPSPFLSPSSTGVISSPPRVLEIIQLISRRKMEDENWETGKSAEKSFVVNPGDKKYVVQVKQIEWG